MKVWLDDERPAPAGWRHVRTVSDAVSVFLAEEPFGGVEEFSLDHDLGAVDEPTGYDFLVWLECEVAAGWIGRDRVPKLHVHSANPPGRKRMEAAIASIQRMAR